MMHRITPLEGLEPVRRRPGMYIGGTDARALNGCVWELTANSIEEHLAGRGASLTVTIHNDGSLSVEDEGGGISVAPHPPSNRPFIELVMTALHIPDLPRKSTYPILGLRGVGTKCVNAVSEWMRINTVWEGNEYQIAFARGRTTEPLTQLPESARARGTTVRFKPDPELFHGVSFDRDSLAVRLDHFAVLHPRLVFRLVDERATCAGRPLASTFHYPQGIADFLKAACAAESRRHPEPVVLHGDVRGVKIALGFQCTRTGNFVLLSFVNSSPTPQNGTHVQGFLNGLTDAVSELGRPAPASQPEEVRAGLNAVVSVWLADPRYGGATKDELINGEVEAAVRELTSDGVKQWAAKSGDHARALIEAVADSKTKEP